MEQLAAEKNLLHDIELDITLEPVSAGTRFLHYLIDTIGFYVLIFIIGGAIGIGAVANDMDVEDTGLVGNAGTAILLQYLLSFLLYVGFYTFMEGMTKGKTLGKYLTGCRVVKDNSGSAISWKDAFLRSLCRVVPFEPFSTFGRRPWHDRWTDTIVIKERK